MKNEWESVTMILSAGSIIMPVIFGGMLWKLTRVFVTREEFDVKLQSYHNGAEVQREEMLRRLNRLESGVETLLQRTAALDARSQK